MRHHDHPGHDDHEEGDTIDASHLVPFPRTSPEQHNTWITGRDWRVERIDTEPISNDHYHAAVAALAVLINDWQHQRKNTTTDHEDGDNVA